MDEIHDKTAGILIFIYFISGIRTWTSWLDGYYLLTNTTLAGDSLTFWVPDCSLANPQYVNNPNTMIWERKSLQQFLDWGDGWTACGIKNGCEVWPGLASQTSYTCKKTIVNNFRFNNSSAWFKQSVQYVTK